MNYQVGFLSFSDDGDTMPTLFESEHIIDAFRFLHDIIGKDNIYFDGDGWETDFKYAWPVDDVFHTGKFWIAPVWD